MQIDALTLDEADSIRRASAFHSDLVTRAASETRLLRELGAGLIVGDIPPLAFAVGAAAGIPSIGLGNFTWDWVYADYPRVRLAPSLLPAIRGAYCQGVDGAAAADVAAASRPSRTSRTSRSSPGTPPRRARRSASS